MEIELLFMLMCFFLVGVEIFVVWKIRIYYISFAIMMVSILVGIGGFAVELPAYPYFQLGFILIQFLLHVSLEYKRRESRFK